MDYQFRILGPPSLQIGETTVHLGRRKHVALLAALLLHCGQPIPTDRLLEMVWDDSTTARGTLQAEINRVRQFLEHNQLGPGKETLHHSAGHYTLRLAREAVDWHQFRNQVTAARAELRRAGPTPRAMELLNSALDLWTADPLGGLESRMLDNVRHLMRQERRAAVHQWAEAGLALGEHAQILPDLTEHASADPLDEKLARCLMIALHGCGRTSEALGIGRSLREVLRADGLSPGPETGELYSRIAANDPTLTPDAQRPVSRSSHLDAPTQPTPPPRYPSELFTLPRDIHDFVGRTEELTRITTGPEQPPPSGITWAITGMAGVGKTTLAMHSAHLLRRQYPDAQLSVQMRASVPPHTPRSAKDVLHTLLHELGVPSDEIPRGEAARSALWRRRTARLRMILILDDAESPQQVLPILPEGPRCLTLVTSRRLLSSLPAQHVPLAPLDDAEAQRLFVSQLGVPPSRNHNAPELAEITRRCGRLPLALCLVAARIREHSSWTTSDAVQLLRHSSDPLGEIRNDETDLASVFSECLASLPAADRHAALFLGLHAGIDFGTDSAAALLDCSLAEADRLLERLHRAYLVEEPRPGCYRHHDLLGQFTRAEARRRLSPVERTVAVRRLLNHYLTRVETAVRRLPQHNRRLEVPLEPGVVPPPTLTVSAAQNLLRSERERFVLATTLAAEYGLPRYTAFLAELITEHLESECLWETAFLLHVDAALWGTEYEHRWRAQGLVRLSRSNRQRGMLAAAEDTARNALVAWEGQHDPLGVADALNALGTVLSARSEFAEALTCHERACALSQGRDDHSEAVSLINVIRARISLGRFDDVVTDAQRAHTLFRRVGSREGEAAATNAKAAVLRAQGSTRAARDGFRHALNLLTADGKRWQSGFVLNNLAEIELDQDRTDTAAPMLESARKIFEETDELNTLVTVRSNLAKSELLRGAPREALAIHRESQRLLDRNILPDVPASRVTILLGIGEVHRHRGAHAKAAVAYQRALRMARSASMEEEKNEALTSLREVVAHTRGVRIARRRWEGASRLYRRLGSPSEAIRARLHRSP